MMILVFWFTLVGVLDVDCMVSYLLCEFWVWVFRFVGCRFSLMGWGSLGLVHCFVVMLRPWVVGVKRLRLIVVVCWVYRLFGC